MMMTRDTLLLTLDTFAMASGLSVSAISKRIFDDHKRLPGVQGGGDLTTRSYDRAMHWLSENWPDGAEWPEGVDRPEPEQVRA